MKHLAFASVAALLAAPLSAQDIETRPYIFTQGHNGEAQKIDFARMVQVQLPSNTGNNGDPLVAWGFEAEENPGVSLAGADQVASPGRIDGYDQVTVFNFTLSDGDEVKISIEANSGNSISENGEFEIKLLSLN